MEKVLKISRSTAFFIVCTIGLNAHAADIAQAGKLAVREQLKDPDSARFRNTTVSGVAYCGEVNAKNSYGGYVGFKRFIAIGSAVLMEPADGSPAFESFWRESCWPEKKLAAYKKRQNEIDALSAKNAEKEKAEHDSVVNQTIEQQQEELRKLGGKIPD